MYVDTTPGEGTGQLHMTVSPDKLLTLADGIETERDRLRTWLRTSQVPLTRIDSPGNDPCSEDTVAVFMRNGESAIAKAEAYVNQLTNVVTELRSSARDYGLVEGDNTDNFRRETE